MDDVKVNATDTGPIDPVTNVQGIRGRIAAIGRHIGRPGRMTALLEQGLLAGIRMVALLVFARILPTEIFGAFALVVSISFIVTTLQRAVVILPFIVACQALEEVAKAIREWWWIAVAGAVATALILLAAWAGTLMLGMPEWIRTVLFFSAIGAPALMLYTFLRRVSYQTGDHRNILVMVLVHFATYATGTGIAFLFRDIHSLAFWAFIAAPLAGCLAGFVHVRKSLGSPPIEAFQSFRNSISFSKWSFFSGMVGAIYANGMNVIVASFLGPVGSAMFAATRTIVSPIISLTGATDMIDKPQAGRAYATGGVHGLRRSVRGTLALLVLLGGPYLVLVSIFAGPILELLYGTKYAGLGFELRIWALAMFLHMVANPLATHLITLKDTRKIFFCNLTGALIALAIALPLLKPLGFVAALLGLSGGRLVNVVLLYFFTRHSVPADRVPSAVGSESFMRDE